MSRRALAAIFIGAALLLLLEALAERWPLPMALVIMTLACLVAVEAGLTLYALADGQEERS